jgi:endoglucanase
MCMFLYRFTLVVLSMVLFSCGGEGTATPINTSTTLSVNPANIQFSSEDHSAQVDITTNSTWSLLVNSDWLTLTPTSGNNNATISITPSNNSSSQMREVTVNIKAGTMSKSLTVFQEGKSPNTPVLPADSTGMRAIDSVAFSQLLGYGFNIGNSLEAIGGETAWGNPLITQSLMDAIKAAGFNSIRLPVAWSQFSDRDNYIIKTQWLDRVKEVVDYAYNSKLVVVMNMHWDGGWMQPTYATQDKVNQRIDAMWTQIAVYFRDYDDHLLFAGTNEVMVEGDYGTPTEEYYTVQNSFNQRFIDTVRATGGRNVYRHLVVQGFNTNIDYTVAFVAMPSDITVNRLMMEVHFYDPFNFTLNENSTLTQWGANAYDASKIEDWANEAFIDAQFEKMQRHFIEKGIGVILGEYGAISRTEDPEHEVFRRDWNYYVTDSAMRHKLAPFYWDNGSTNNHGMGLFNRITGEQVYPEIIEVISGPVTGQ